MNIGERIKQRRIELDMSQDELAAKMGYKNRSTIAKIEKGINDVVQSNIVKFSEVLDVNISYLMGWEEVQKSNDTIVDIIARLRTDEEFLSTVQTLYNLDKEKLRSVQQMLSAFTK